MDDQKMAEGSELFQIDAGDGKTLYVEVRRGDTIRDLRERLADANVTMDVCVDGTPLNEETNALAYFSALSNNKSGEEEEELPCTELEENVVEVVGSFCSVLGCPTNKFDHPDVALFKFPTEKKRCLDWIAAVNRPDLSTEPVNELSQKYSVCANHFARAQFASRQRKVLKETAVPIIFKGNQSIDSRMETKKSLVPHVIIKREPEDGYEKSTSVIPIQELLDEEKNVHPGSLCRLCANIISSSAMYIFKQDHNGKTIAEKINACLPVSVKKTDTLPKQICQVCAQHLTLQNSFVETCLKAEEKLRTLTQRYLVHGLKNPTIPSEGARGKNKQSYCCPLCCNGAMQYQLKDNSSASSCPTAPIPSSPAPGFSSQEIVAGLYSDDADSDGGGGMDEAGEVLIKIEEDPESIYTAKDMTALSFECEICEEIFTESGKCFEHCKIHCGPDHFPCIVCGLVFTTEDELSEHFSDHKTNIPPTRKIQWKPILECGTCENQFSTKKDFIIHSCANPVLKTVSMCCQEAQNNCEECDRVFKTVARAEIHHETHAGVQMHTCQECDFEAETPRILSDHVAVIHDVIAVHGCQICSLRFSTERNLEKHLKVHQKIAYECSTCNLTFQSYELTQNHVFTHGTGERKTPEKPGEFRCSKCSKTFSQRGQLQHHLESTHDTIKGMPSLIQYQCKLCGERITNSADVLNHRTVHFKGTAEPEWPYICEYCGDAHPSPNALARHRRCIHPDERPYVCTLCNVATRTLYEARVHRKTHTGYVAAAQKPQPKIYQCELCPSLFSDKLNFLSHKKSHKVSKWYKCDQCDKTFPERHRLNVHMRQHTGEKPFSCGTCGKLFAQSSALYTHALLHTGETPHSCDMCDRKFRIKADRDNHRRTHTGEKPYKCQYCSKTFRTGQVYYQHRMIHTGERRFPCDICGRAFKRSHTLVCHRRIHTGEKPNICDICGKAFRQRSDMRKHKMNLHGVPA